MKSLISLLRDSFSFIFCACLPVCMYVHLVHAVPIEDRESVGYWVVVSCQVEGWGPIPYPDSSPLQEQQALLTSQPSLQS